MKISLVFPLPDINFLIEFNFCNTGQMDKLCNHVSWLHISVRFMSYIREPFNLTSKFTDVLIINDCKTICYAINNSTGDLRCRDTISCLTQDANFRVQRLVVVFGSWHH